MLEPFTPLAASCVMSFLEDVPAAAFQAILHHLRGPDVASLRLVNRSICLRATAAPYIVLRITSSTTMDDLRQWAQATRRFQDVSTIYIHCRGQVQQETFDAVLKLLSRRGRVSALHLTSAPEIPAANLSAMSPHASMLPSLEPLNYLQRNLMHLHISGLAVNDLAADLAKFAVAGSQLQTLALQDVQWKPVGTATLAEFAAAVLQLPLRCPNLRHLRINMPTIGTRRTAEPGAAAEQRMEAVLASAKQLPELRAAALAILAAVCAQLKQLQSLSITGAPGIRLLLPSPRSSCADFALVASATAAAAVPHLQLPPTGLHSMDAIGSWLLGRLPQLRHLRLSSRDSVWSMTWQQQQQQVQSCSSFDSGNTSNSQALYDLAPSITGTYHAFVTADEATSNRDTATPALMPDFVQQLTGHSVRPVSLLLPRINTLHLSIQRQQLPDLHSLLGALVNLRHCKITLMNTSSQACGFAALVAAAAAAGRGNLQSLALLPGNNCVEVASHMLQPLVACSKLQQLKLVGCFTAAAGDACAAWGPLRQLTGLRELIIQQLGPDTLQLPVACLPVSLQALEGRRLHLAGSSSSSRGGGDGGGVVAAVAAPEAPSSSSASETAVAAVATAAALPALQRLHLQQCSLHDPASLASVNLQQLTSNASSWQGGWAAATAAWPRLTCLTACCLSMHSSCCSSCCDEANVLDAARRSCSISKGKPNAADDAQHAGGATSSAAPSRPCGYRAWRGYDDEAGSNREMLAAWAAAAGQAASLRLLQGLAEGFRALESVSVQHVPCLTPAVLQLMWQLPALRQVELASTVVSGSWQNVLDHAAAAQIKYEPSNSSSMSRDCGAMGCFPPSLKNLTLHVPHSTPAGQLLSPLFIAKAQPAAAGATNEHGIGGLSLQQALQQQLPWVGVNVVHARSLPC